MKRTIVVLASILFSAHVLASTDVVCDPYIICTGTNISSCKMPRDSFVFTMKNSYSISIIPNVRYLLKVSDYRGYLNRESGVARCIYDLKNAQAIFYSNYHIQPDLKLITGWKQESQEYFDCVPGYGISCPLKFQ